MAEKDAAVAEALAIIKRSATGPSVVEQSHRWGPAGTRLKVFVDEVLVGTVYGPFEGEWTAYLQANQGSQPSNLDRRYLTFERARKELFAALELEQPS